MLDGMPAYICFNLIFSFNALWKWRKWHTRLRESPNWARSISISWRRERIRATLGSSFTCAAFTMLRACEAYLWRGEKWEKWEPRHKRKHITVLFDGISIYLFIFIYIYIYIYRHTVTLMCWEFHRNCQRRDWWWPAWQYESYRPGYLEESCNVKEICNMKMKNIRVS